MSKRSEWGSSTMSFVQFTFPHFKNGRYDSLIAVPNFEESAQPLAVIGIDRPPTCHSPLLLPDSGKKSQNKTAAAALTFRR